jgi:ABC-2 type transport system ATP-binding protein
VTHARKPDGMFVVVPDAPVISIESLSKRFSNGVLAVDDLSFDVQQGDICGLLGPNGAGKTTSLRVLLGLVRPTRGSVRLFGERMRPGAPVLARVGTMIEQAAFVPYLSGKRNLELWWEAAAGASWPPPALDRALDIAGLGSALDRPVKSYSLGMHQRLGIARALLGAPDVLVLDEPTVGLDPQEMRSIRRLLHDLGQSGVTVLLSSHLLAEVEEICSHVVVMDRGRLVAAGTVAELTNAGPASAYLEVDDVAAARRVLTQLIGADRVADAPPGLAIELDGMRRAEVVAELVRAGVGVETVMQRHGLEDAFVGLVGEETARDS